MPKGSPKPSGGSSKIRFIMLEADLSDGDLTQITQAISNALSRPTPQPTRLLINGTPAASVRADAESGSADEIEQEDEIDNGEDVAAAPAPRARAPRKFRTPKVLSDVDLNSGDMPFSTFALERNPAADLGRYLLVAYWFKTYRSMVPVSADHVYTCYKKVGWGTSIRDFMQPFRDLARQGKGEVKDSKFTINHIGEDAVDKMKAKQ